MSSDNNDITGARHQRMRDALRLAQTRRQNLEESIRNLRTLQDKLYRHQQLDSELAINSRQLFVLTKEYASMSDEADEMDRFETFESIMAPFLRMQMLETEAEDNRRAGNELSQQMRETGNEMEELRKVFTHSRDNLRITETQHLELCRTIEECSRHDGACAAIEETAEGLNKTIAHKEDRLNELKSKADSAASLIREYEKKLELLGGRRHTLESHESMLERADLVLVMLQRLEELLKNLEHKKQLYNRNSEEQKRCNEELARISSQHNDIEQQIQNLQSEVEIHRTNIRGMQSYDVQERAMNLKSRLLMLGAAQSLWQHISTGYANIEEKTRLINSLRLEIEHDLKAEQELTVSVAALKRQAADKEYSLNMSKSQSLISLRADLKEGTACSVCGATHHPYHSDTMLDQYKLISDFRSDFETVSGELQGAEKQLAQLHDKLTRNLGQQIAEQHNLETVRTRQSEDVREWRLFSKLDPTFHDCSASTDSYARMATIRQLLDNAKRELQSAEAVLGDFNYHTAQISDLSERIAGLENRKSEISLRMNEGNTTCRILAAEGERLDTSRRMAQEKYHGMYKLLQNDITIPEWLKLWQQNPESLYMAIKQMASDWNAINTEIEQTGRLLTEARIRQEMLLDMQQMCSMGIDEIKDELRKQNNKSGELQERRQTLLPGIGTGEALDRSQKNLQQAQHEHTMCIEKLHDLALRQKEQEGAYGKVRQIGEELDRLTSTQRNVVDLWIRAYNASNPPVQYNELSSVLTRDTNWNRKRQVIRENRMATFLQQQKVKALQAEIVALEVDTGPLTGSQLAEKQIATETQLEQQESALREVASQIARLEIGLGI